MRDIVDSVDFWPLGSRDRFRNPRCGDSELARRLDEGEPGPRHEVHRQLGSQGGDPASASPNLELCQPDPGMPGDAGGCR